MKCFILISLFMGTAIANAIQDTTVRPAVQACQSYSQHSTDGFKFPWMAALGYIHDSRQNITISFNCAGTVISDLYILTAAHCTQKSRRPVMARLGSATLTGQNVDFSAKSYLVEKIIRHPNYSVFTKNNDIALIQLESKIEFLDNIRPACLHTDSNDIDPNVKLLVTGWGTINYDQHPSNELKKMEVTTAQFEQCNRTFSNFTEQEQLSRIVLTEGHYCTNDGENGKGPCRGDGGAPIQYFPTTSSVVPNIVAIVSFGVDCGGPIPSINTRIAHHLEWIESIVWPLGK